jgi:peptidoglycan/LPS O-acetylase OafA/YrhL
MFGGVQYILRGPAVPFAEPKKMSPSQQVASTSTEPGTPGPRIPILDGLRSLVILVLVVHYTDSVALAPPAKAVFYLVQLVAAVGLDVFFALSGFLITGILLDTKGAAGYFRKFYLRRILRIFPLYYGTLLVFLIVLPAVSNRFENERLTVSQHTYYWTYLVNLAESFGWHVAPSTGHFWSLGVEEQFYLLWPAVVYWCTRARLRSVCIALLVVSPFIRLYLVHVLPETPAFHQLERFDVIAIGGLLALASRTPDGLVEVRRWLRPAAYAAMVVMVGGFLVVPVLQAEALFSSASAYVAAFVLVTTLQAAPETRWAKVVGSSPLRRIGMYSYGIYVLHDPLADTIARFGFLDYPRQGTIEALVYCAKMVSIAVAAGALTWHFYEQPFLRLKSKFSYGRPRDVREARAS